MRIKRRALRGYSSSSVREAEHALKKHYQEIRGQMEGELDELKSDNKRLLAELERLRDEVLKEE